MLQVMCRTEETLLLGKMEPFQGTLKRRTEKDLAMLWESLRTEGLITPFVIWYKDGVNYLLDGHGRHQVLCKAAERDPELLEQKFPVLYVEASTEQGARKALLQISSQYGKVTKNGLLEFTRTIPEYKAPVVKIPQPKVVRLGETVSEFVIVRLKVKKEVAEGVLGILKQVEGVEVY